MPSSSSTRQSFLVVERPSTPLPRYLFRRGDTLYFKRKIPVDVAHGFPEFKDQMWKSLGTHLVEKAKVLLAVEVTEFNLKVAELRRAQAVRSAADRLSSEASPAPSRVSAPAQEPVVPPRAILRLSAGRAAHLPVAPSPAPVVVASAVRDREPSPKQLPAPCVPARARPELTRPTTSKGTAGTDSLNAPSALVRPVAVRSVPAGTVNAPQPAKSLPPPGPARPTMLHLFEDWKRKQTRPRTVNSVRTAVMEFRTLHGQLAVDELTRAHARAYRDHLIERRLSKVTIENRLGILATLVRHGMREMLEALSVNPFEHVEVTGATGQRKSKDRRAYEVFELNALFSSRLYTEGYRPDGQCVDAAYWAPLLGPFLGARIEEVSQLRVEDVQRVNGTWCVRICDLGENQKVKTASSFRRVPLHESVIQAGFLVYVARMAKAGHEQLFPTLSNDNANGIYSNALGKWYGRYLESIGLEDHRLDYHSFRYTFRQQCSLCGVENETRDALTGHWLSNSDAGRAYMKAENRQYPFPKLVGAMKLLRYDELRVEHLFVLDPMMDVEAALLR